MKNINFLTRSAFYAFAAMISCAMLFSACHKNDDPEPIPPVVPTVKTTYSIHGVVTSLVKGEAVKEAAVKITGVGTAEAKTNANGEFLVDGLEKTGAYQVEVTKDGLTTTSISVNLTGTLADVVLQMPNVPVKTTAKATEESALTLPKEENAVAVEVKLQIPIGAVTKDQEITVKQTVDVVPASATNKGMSLIVLNYQPDGTTFEIPCALEITNPIGEYSFENPALEWLDPKTNAWVKQAQSVDYEGNSYKTTIQHFSSYKISIPDVVGSVISSTEELAALESTDNLDGKADVKVEKIAYTYKRGTIYTTTPEDAAKKAGIADAKVIAFIKSSVNSQKLVGTALTNVQHTYPVNVTIPKGVRMDAKGKQTYSTSTYNFNFVKEGKTVTATVVTKTAGDVAISTSLYTKQHTGGSSN